MTKLIVISGAPGVGKTYFAKKLIKKLESTFYIDTDIFSDEIKETLGDRVFDEKISLTKMVLNTLEKILNENKSINSIVIVHSFKRNQQLKKVTSKFKQKDAYVFELKTTESKHKKQVENRKNRMSDYNKVKEFLSEKEEFKIKQKFSLNLSTGIANNITFVKKIINENV